MGPAPGCRKKRNTNRGDKIKKFGAKMRAAAAAMDMDLDLAWVDQ